MAGDLAFDLLAVVGVLFMAGVVVSALWLWAAGAGRAFWR